VIGRSKRPDVETLHPLGALFEPVFRTALVPAFLDGARIFRTTKLITEPRRTALAHEKQRGDAGSYNHCQTDD